jgi:poly(hydroxyalkanoate) granule-associated protein
MAKQNGEQHDGAGQSRRLVRTSAAGDGGLVSNLRTIGERIDREAKSRVFEARASASEAWDRLESAFVYRVARALNALQIPTARDVRELNHRVVALHKAVEALERRAAEAAAARPSRKVAARKKSTGVAKKAGS